jgi:hypothetical protein
MAIENWLRRSQLREICTVGSVRAAYIYPVLPRQEPNFSYRLLRALYPVFRLLFPNQVISADDLGWAMVDVVLRQTQERQGVVFENRDIRAMVKSQMPVRDRAA